MDEKLTPEEVSEITGEDIEDVRDEQEPERLEPEEGDDPDLELAPWDDEIEEEDKDDPHLKDMDFSNLTTTDRELYLEIASLRQAMHEGTTENKKATEKIDELSKKVKNEFKKGLIEKDREFFLAFLGNKLQVLSFEVLKSKNEG